jgi:FkbM family methyltransferase
MENKMNANLQINPYCTYEDWKRCRWGFDWRVIAEGVLRAPPLKAVEVGIGPLEISMLPYFSEGSTTHCIGIEANPRIAAVAEAAMPRARIIHAACTDGATPTVDLMINGGSSAVAGYWCPTPSAGQRVTVPTITYAAAVGEVCPDIVNIDCEGCEHFVLESMDTLGHRPAVIGIELWPKYPKAVWCEQWLLSHGYRPIFATGPESETQIWTRV